MKGKKHMIEFFCQEIEQELIWRMESYTSEITDWLKGRVPVEDKVALKEFVCRAQGILLMLAFFIR